METIIPKCFPKNLFITFLEKFWFLELLKFLLKIKKVLFPEIEGIILGVFVSRNKRKAFL